MELNFKKKHKKHTQVTKKRIQPKKCTIKKHESSPSILYIYILFDLTAFIQALLKNDRTPTTIYQQKAATDYFCVIIVV